MVEDTGSEAVPPDIRPCGRYNRIKPNSHYGHRATPVIRSSTSAVRTGLPISFIDSLREIEVGNDDRLSTKSVHSRTGALRNASLFALAFAALALLPSAAATPFNSSLVGADPYTSYPATALKSDTYNWNRQPIISSLKWVFLHVVDSLAGFTRLDLRAAGYHTGAFVAGAIPKREQLSTGQTVEAAITPVLVVLSGIFAGLTLGYFSVDPTQLQVLSISGTPKQQEYARKIMPVRKDSHLLLTTLILGNMIVNEALPVVMDSYLGGGIQSVVISTALVVIFAEIIPQSVCSRYGLLIGASMAWPVRILIYIAFPIAWPIAKLLEYILGAHHGIIYRRSELRELIKMHAAGAEGGGDLDLDTVTMAQGALDLAGKTVKEAMTPIDSVFMLPIEAKLDYETLGHVVRSGHSRIPVYQMVEVPDINLSQPTLGPGKTKLVKKVLGSLLVKSCVLLDPEDATPLASIPINAIPSVPWDEPLTNMLNVFQEGRSHMAIVSRRSKRIENDPVDAESVMTAAAGGLRQRFMRKVAEIAHGGSSGSDTDGSESESDLGRAEKATKRSKKSRRKSEAGKSVSKASVTSSGSPSSTVGSSSAADQVKREAQATNAEVQTTEKPTVSEPAAEKDMPEKKKSGGGIAQAVQLTQLEQSIPADAQMPSALVDKFFEGLEGAPLGIITLEDVLEELIGEEIYDEYDAHGPGNPASAFVPREAALAARKAALAREKALAETAAATPLPQDVEPEQPAPAPKRTIIPKLPVKFSLGKKPVSQPGKSRTAPPAAFVTPNSQAAETKTSAPLIDAAKPTVEEPETLVPGSVSDGGHQDTGLTARSQSEKGLSDRRASSGANLSSLEPVSAVPARMLPIGVAAPIIAAAGAPPNMLSEAIMIERGRRRMAVPGVARAPSAPGVTRGVSMTPARIPTPPSTGAGAPSHPLGTEAPPTAASGSAGIVHSPQPIAAGKRGMFKSVPTPLPGTPVPSSDYFEPKRDKAGPGP